MILGEESAVIQILEYLQLIDPFSASFQDLFTLLKARFEAF